MKKRVKREIGNGDERGAVREWVRWCCKHVKTTDATKSGRIGRQERAKVRRPGRVRGSDRVEDRTRTEDVGAGREGCSRGVPGKGRARKRRDREREVSGGRGRVGRGSGERRELRVSE